MAYSSSSGSYTPFTIPEIANSQDLWLAFQRQFPEYALEVFSALFPILLFFLIFQVFFLRLRRRQVVKILVGMLYSYIGLTLFLTGVNVGFMPAGNYLGMQLASLPYRWIMVPVGMVIGYYIVKAEPAVQVLNKQVEEITGGTIPAKDHDARPLRWNGHLPGPVHLPGAHRSAPFVPTGCRVTPLPLGSPSWCRPIFTSIAFDSGGVASGPMTATFLLPFAMGACEAVGGNILTDAFGIVAMVAMTPLIIIQLIGLLYKVNAGKPKPSHTSPAPSAAGEIIDLNEEEPA